MCGINGFTFLNTSFESRAVLSSMNNKLKHRGPDDEGCMILSFASIGMRRLSVIDLKTGHQPISNENGRVWIVYNGELYNYKELRHNLIEKGHLFETQSDTEVIVHLYEEYGMDCVYHLNGIFAFAIVDLDLKTIALVRDHFGVKPLYYYLTPSHDIIFSSEITSLLEHPSIPRKVDDEGLVAFLSQAFVPDPITAIKGVSQIPPGSYLTWNFGKVLQKKYWSYKFRPDFSYTKETAIEKFSSLLKDSVQRQMISDVPLAIFLSGGIDSSTVAAFAADISDTPIKTFSVKFADNAYDESYYSRLVAKHLRSDHYEIIAPDSGFEPEILDLIVQHVGQPFADTSIIPTYLISKYVRKYATVCLSGDGGDELFAGYSHIYWAARMIRSRQNIPHFLRSLGYQGFSLASQLPLLNKSRLMRHARKGLGNTLYDIPEIIFRMRALYQPEELKSIFTLKRYRENIEKVMLRFCNSIDMDSRLQPEEIAISGLINGSLPGAILRKVDRMSMANGLEVRVPLLDYRIGEFSACLPFSLKSSQGNHKYLLREVGRPYLPEEIYSHRKQGFSIPLFKWFNAKFWNLADYYLGVKGCSPIREIIDQKSIDTIINQGRNAYEREGIISHGRASHRIWSLVILARWIDKMKMQL